MNIRELESRGNGFVAIAKPVGHYFINDDPNEFIRMQFKDMELALEDIRGDRTEDEKLERMRNLRWLNSNRSIDQVREYLRKMEGGIAKFDGYLRRQELVVLGRDEFQTIVTPRMNVERPENALAIYRDLTTNVGAIVGDGMLFNTMYVGPADSDLVRRITETASGN